MDFDNNKSPKSLSTKSHEKPWHCIAITMDPEGTRYKTFLEKNNHLPVETFQGVKGSDLSKEEIISQGIATDDLASTTLLTRGAAGCAASHRAIWQKCVQENDGYFVLEDDACTHPRIADFINENLTRLMCIDICFFGINSDSILQSISPTGLATLSLFDPQHPSQEWIRNALSKTRTNEVVMHRLIKAFGFCAYFISPNGAKKLSAKLFPLSLVTTKIPLITNQMPATTIDRAGCREYSQLDAFICQPFLAYTPNIDSSTRA